MADFFDVRTIGRLTRDPELHHLPNGTIVTEFGLATNKSYKGSDGEWKDNTVFSDWQAWGDRAQYVIDRLHKGAEVYLEGEYSPQNWEDKATGQKRTASRFKLTRFRPFAKSTKTQVDEKSSTEKTDEEILPF